MPAATVWTRDKSAVIAFVAQVAVARAQNTFSPIIAVGRALQVPAVFTGPASVADTLALYAATVARAIVWTLDNTTVTSFEAWVAVADSVLAVTLEVAVVNTVGGKLAILASKTRVAHALAFMAVAVAVAVARAAGV